MVITIVCDVFGEDTNGTIVATNNLIKFLKKQGHTIRILSAEQSKAGQENYFIVPTMNFGKLLNAYVAKVGVSLAKADKEIVKKSLKGADHVHIMLPFSLGVAAAKIAHEMGISTSAGFHMQAENFTSYIKLNKLKPLNHGVYKFIWKHMYKYIDGIHYPTKFIRDIFESNIKQKTNGYIISNGVHEYVKKRECNKPEEFKDKIVILSIGRYAREKSQDTILKAINYSKYKNKIQVILAGEGVKEKYYKKLSKNLKIKPIFNLYSRDDLVDIINYADLYVHPAEMELEGIACLEAIACGKLTIVSNSKLSATKDFAIDERCIFEKRNPKDLARVIDYWIDNPKEKLIYEKQYLDNAVIYNQQDCMKKMEEMILEIHNEKQKNKA